MMHHDRWLVLAGRKSGSLETRTTHTHTRAHKKKIKNWGCRANQSAPASVARFVPAVAVSPAAIGPFALRVLG